jgi:hypothetical protein
MQLQEKGDDIDNSDKSLESPSITVSVSFSEVTSPLATSQRGHEESGMEIEMYPSLVKTLTAI